MPRKHPSTEMIKELNDLFQKHNWPGAPVGIRANNADDAAECPAGTTPKQVTYQLPDGSWVTKTICV